MKNARELGRDRSRASNFRFTCFIYLPTIRFESLGQAIRSSEAGARSLGKGFATRETDLVERISFVRDFLKVRKSFYFIERV